MKNELPPNVQNIKNKLHFEEMTGRIWLEDQRMFLMHYASFSALQTELIKALGIVRAQGLMWRMGHASGRSDAELAKKTYPDVPPEKVFSVGPQLLSLEGIVDTETIQLEMDLSSGEFFGEFYWDYSFEADEHIKKNGIHSEPVCWMQIGYASGYTSEFVGVPVFYKELGCVGCGDERCHIVGKPLPEWEDSELLSQFYSLDPIAENLLLLNDEVQELRNVIRGEDRPEDIINKSKATKEILSLINKASQTNVTVLMLGETGVGKDVFSHYLHAAGDRKDSPFVVVNCAALPQELIEAELFGVERGAYTGADKSRKGKFERAHKGTIFLDEIGELSIGAQAKLLRVIQSGDFERVGDTKSRKVDVRIIAATNVALEDKVSSGDFRADLFYRLNVFPIYIPPLRERTDDIPSLANKFVKKYAIRHHKKAIGISEELMELFVSYEWPGNIRELKNLIERGVILTEHGEDLTLSCINVGKKNMMGKSNLFERESFLNSSQDLEIDPVDLLITSGLELDELEKQILEKVLLKVDGNINKASNILGLTAPQYRYRLKKHGHNIKEG